MNVLNQEERVDIIATTAGIKTSVVGVKKNLEKIKFLIYSCTPRLMARICQKGSNLRKVGVLDWLVSQIPILE